MTVNSKKEFSQTADNALKILACFTTREELGISELSRELGLGKASISRLVAALERNGFLMQSAATGKYQLGLALMMYGSLAKERNALARAFDPCLRLISEKYQTTAHMGALLDGELVIINKVSAGPLIYMSSRIGGSLPLYASAMGKCLLAYSEQALQNQLISQLSFTAYTPSTKASVQELYDDLALVRRRGYALDDEERHEGLFCIALPVLDRDGRPLAAISTSGPKEKIAPLEHEIVQFIQKQISGTI